MHISLVEDGGEDKCTPLLWPCIFSCWRGDSCVFMYTSGGLCCLLVCVLVRRNSMGSKLWVFLLLHPNLGGYRTRWQWCDSWQHVSRDQTAMLSAFHSHTSPHSLKFPSSFYTSHALFSKACWQSLGCCLIQQISIVSKHCHY